MQSRTSSGAISIKKLGSREFKGISCYVCNAQKHKTEKNPRYTSRCRKSDSAYSEICFQKKKMLLVFSCILIYISKFKMVSRLLVLLEDGKSVPMHSNCRKLYMVRAQRQNIPVRTKNDTDVKVQSLEEIYASGGSAALHNHSGPFTYTHYPSKFDTTTSCSPDDKKLANKALFCIVQSLGVNRKCTSGSKVETHMPVKLTIRNTSSKNCTHYVKVVKGRKVATALSRKQAKRRVNPLEDIVDNFMGLNGNKADVEKLFELAPKRIGCKLNDITASSAGVKICPFEAVTLAALELKCDLSYKQSTFLRYFLKKQGCGKLFDGRCSEKKVRSAKVEAGSTIAFKFGTCNVFTKKEESLETKQVCYISVESFDAAVAWNAAERDRRRTYMSFKFPEPGTRLLLIGGDTGGRHFNFFFLDTHKEHVNSGVECNVWVMCDKFKETHRNLQQVLSPLVTDDMEALIGGCKMLIRIKEVKQKQDCKFNCAAVVSNCRNINPHFTSQIISLGRTFNKEQLKKIPQPAAILRGL